MANYVDTNIRFANKKIEKLYLRVKFKNVKDFNGDIAYVFRMGIWYRYGTVKSQELYDRLRKHLQDEPPGQLFSLEYLEIVRNGKEWEDVCKKIFKNRRIAGVDYFFLNSNEDVIKIINKSYDAVIKNIPLFSNGNVLSKLDYVENFNYQKIMDNNTGKDWYEYDKKRCLYLAKQQNVFNPNCKCGSTRGLKRRMKDMCSATTPNTVLSLEKVIVLDDSNKNILPRDLEYYERYLHKKMEKYHIYGEWFAGYTNIEELFTLD